MKKFAVVAFFITLIAVGGFMYFRSSHGGPATQTVSQSDAKIEASIGKAEGKSGDTVEIPISLKGVPSKGIDACDFSIVYDQNLLESLDVLPGGIIYKPTDLESSKPQIGKIKILFTTDNGYITKDGVFTKLKFKIKSGAQPGTAFVKLDSLGSFVETGVKEISTHFTEGSVEIKK
ncbi:MAG TPA: cohesin domain-containing protein [Clostridia bacterium]